MLWALRVGGPPLPVTLNHSWLATGSVPPSGPRHLYLGIGILPQRELWVLGPSSSPRPTADGGGSFSPRLAALTGLGPIHGTPCGARAAGPHRSVRALGPSLSATLPEGAQPFTREGCPGRKTRIQFRMRRWIPVEEADGWSPGSTRQAFLSQLPGSCAPVLPSCELHNAVPPAVDRATCRRWRPPTIQLAPLTIPATGLRS